MLSDIDNNFEHDKLLVYRNNQTFMGKTVNFTESQPPIVSIGAKVLIDVQGELQTWEIVNPGESDIPNGKISCQAPLIQCILGAKIGDKVKVKLLYKDITVVIKDISFL